MERATLLGLVAGVLLVGGACSDSAEQPAPTTGTSSERIAPSTSAFTSQEYGYSLAVPEGWDVVAASSTWDGGDVDHTASYADRLTSNKQAQVFALGTATQDSLEDVTSAHAAWLVSARGCDPPQGPTDSTLDATPARRLVFRCPQGVYGQTLVTKAIAVRDGEVLILTSFSPDDGTDSLPAFEEMLDSFRWQP
jgi:hypothetical protein